MEYNLNDGIKTDFVKYILKLRECSLFSLKNSARTKEK